MKKIILFNMESQETENFLINKDYPTNKSANMWKKAYYRVKSHVMYTKMTHIRDFNRLSTMVSMKTFTPIKTSMPILIIHPNSSVKYAWNGVLTLLLIYTATVTPFRTCFIDSVLFTAWWWIDTVVDILFFIDVLVNINSAYFDEFNKLQTSRKGIILRYLKSWMLLDITACMPFSLFNDSSSNSSSNNYVRLIRLFRLYRLSKLFRMIKIMKKFDDNDSKSQISKMFTISQTTWEFIEFLIKTLIAIHIISCFWYLAARLNNFGPNTWVVYCGFQDLEIQQLYLRSFYWAFTTLTTVGYGDITPINNIEIGVTIIWISFVMCFFSYTLGVLSSMISSQSTKDYLLENKLLAIDEFITEENLPKTLKLQIIEAVKYSNEKVGFTWADKLHIFEEFPADLRYEIATTMHSGTAIKIPFFYSKDKVFVAAVVPFLQNMHETKGSFLYEKGFYASDIYFVISGCINLLYQDIPLKVYRSGKCIGDIEVIEKTKRMFSAYVSLNSQLLTMGKDVCDYIKQEFPNYYEDMKMSARMKKHQILTAKKKLKIFQKFKKEDIFTNQSHEQIQEIVDIEYQLRDAAVDIQGHKSSYSRFLENVKKIDQHITTTELKLMNTLKLTENLLKKNKS